MKNLAALTVIYGCRNTPVSDAVGIFGCPPHQNGVAVRVTEQNSDQCIGAPRILHRTRPKSQRDNAWKSPDILQHGDQCTFVVSFAEPGYPQQREDVRKVGRDG
jgi:hypothetical protein